jgi:hypothetical protein
LVAYAAFTFTLYVALLVRQRHPTEIRAS